MSFPYNVCRPERSISLESLCIPMQRWEQFAVFELLWNGLVATVFPVTASARFPQDEAVDKGIDDGGETDETSQQSKGSKRNRIHQFACVSHTSVCGNKCDSENIELRTSSKGKGKRKDAKDDGRCNSITRSDRNAPGRKRDI